MKTRSLGRGRGADVVVVSTTRTPLQAARKLPSVLYRICTQPHLLLPTGSGAGGSGARCVGCARAKGLRTVRRAWVPSEGAVGQGPFTVTCFAGREAGG